MSAEGHSVDDLNRVDENDASGDDGQGPTVSLDPALKDYLTGMLPASTRYELVSCEPATSSTDKQSGLQPNSFKAVLNAELNTGELCENWVSEFSQTSFCTWRVRSTFKENRRGVLYRKDYACQHSSYNKTHYVRQKTKDTGCPARMIVKVKSPVRSNSKQNQVADELPCSITIFWMHNHDLTSAAALSYRSASSEIRDQFLAYFDAGMSPAVAIKHHKECLMNSDDFKQQDLVDASKNPVPRAVYFWHAQWRKDDLDMRASGVRCCIPGCNSRANVDIEKSFHKFPYSNSKLLGQWIASIDSSHFMPSRTSRVCSDHFTPDSFDRKGMKVCLHDDAVPTIFPEYTPKRQRGRKSKQFVLNNLVSQLGFNGTSDDIELEMTSGTSNQWTKHAFKSANGNEAYHDVQDIRFVKAGKIKRKEVAKHVRDNNLRHSLLQFQKDGYLCDTVLVGDGGRVKVHGIVLAAASDMFKGLLKSHEKPSENILVLPGVEQDLLNIIVHLAYTGDIVMPGAHMTSEEVSRVVKILLELGFTLPSLSDDAFDIDQSEHTDGTIQLASDSELTVALEKLDDNEEVGGVYSDLVEALCSEHDDQEEYDENAEVTVEKRMKTECDEVVDESSGESPPTETADCDAQQSEDAEEFAGDSGDLSADASADAVQYEQQKLLAGKGRSRHLSCSVCNTQCSNTANLRRHMKLHTGERPHLCQHCGAGFIQYSTLQYHIISRHPEMVGSDPAVNTYQCPKCDQVFFHSHRLRQHIKANCDPKFASIPRSHFSTEKKHLCRKCGRYFISKASLIIHSRTHNPVVTHDPRIALKIEQMDVDSAHVGDVHEADVDKFQADIVDHQRQHATGSKSHVCPVCSVVLKTANQLHSHMLSHTGEKPYSCHICGKQMAQLGTLKQHIRTHTGERPYKCTYCGNEFVQATHLSTHMRSHTGEKPFGCELCEKSYKSMMDLRLHYQRIHQVDLPKKRGASKTEIVTLPV